jgi:thiol-disulfide isomerase/thioredoxin
MRNNVFVILTALLVLSVVISAIILYRDAVELAYVDGLVESESQAGDLAPDFSALLLTGETFTLSEHRGMVVVLNFWATWCGPCVEKMPLHRLYPRNMMAVL